MHALLKEAMDPIYIELGAVKCKLEQVTTETKCVTNLEEQLKFTKAKLEYFYDELKRNLYHLKVIIKKLLEIP